MQYCARSNPRDITFNIFAKQQKLWCFLTICFFKLCLKEGYLSKLYCEEIRKLVESGKDNIEVQQEWEGKQALNLYKG